MGLLAVETWVSVVPPMVTGAEQVEPVRRA
jgi:hypothetical protein